MSESSAAPPPPRPSQPVAPPPMQLELDEDGLLCALVLVPSTYSRNRWFALYQDPKMRAIRGRARMIRSLVRQLARAGSIGRATRTAAGLELEIEVPALSLRRRATLSAAEEAVFAYCLSRTAPGAHPELTNSFDHAAITARVEQALLGLGGPFPGGLQQG